MVHKTKNLSWKCKRYVLASRSEKPLPFSFSAFLSTSGNITNVAVVVIMIALFDVSRNQVRIEAGYLVWNLLKSLIILLLAGEVMSDAFHFSLCENFAFLFWVKWVIIQKRPIKSEEDDLFPSHWVYPSTSLTCTRHTSQPPKNIFFEIKRQVDSFCYISKFKAPASVCTYNMNKPPRTRSIVPTAWHKAGIHLHIRPFRLTFWQQMTEKTPNHDYFFKKYQFMTVSSFQNFISVERMSDLHLYLSVNWVDMTANCWNYILF